MLASSVEFTVDAPQFKAGESCRPKGSATRERYGFFGCDGTGCELVGACCKGGCAAGCCPAGGCDDGCVFDCGVAGVEAGGAVGFVAGIAGVVAGAGLGAGCETFCRTEPPCSTALSLRNTKAIAHSMNMTAHHVVAFERTLAAPRGPNAVWLPAPPNAPARSAALPLCRSTTTISTKQLTTKKVGNTQKNQRESDSLHPATIMAAPISNATVHFIQPGISIPRV